MLSGGVIRWPLSLKNTLGPPVVCDAELEGREGGSCAVSEVQLGGGGGGGIAK
jgi:hypothetical protein